MWRRLHSVELIVCNVYLYSQGDYPRRLTWNDIKGEWKEVGVPSKF